MDSDTLQEHIYSVSELNDEVASLLGINFGIVWIEGEISNYMKSAAGHSYFSLKDPTSSVRCAMFRLQNQSLNFELQDGQHILAKVKVGLYQARGEYQLIVEYAEQAGEGLLRQKFELLKKKLEAEGLFESIHKQTLPLIPTKIGIISSPKSAAIQDIFKTITRRFNLVELLVYPTLVQGQEATKQICQAINIANHRDECSVIILARGGGSLEDLWCFNEEEVARAIFESSIPIITGIGHETDTTIADMVSDLRAPTPTGAAEMILPEKTELINAFKTLSRQITQAFSLMLKKLHNVLMQDQIKLEENHPKTQLQQHSQRLDAMQQKIQTIPNTYLNILHSSLNNKINALAMQNPKFTVDSMYRDLKEVNHHLVLFTQQVFNKQQQQFSIAITKLDGISPLQALSRGYAYVTDDHTGQHVKSLSTINKGSKLTTRLHDGTFKSYVTEIKKKS
jgi:exodeoxyribonuclease VII large subunit